MSPRHRGSGYDLDLPAHPDAAGGGNGETSRNGWRLGSECGPSLIIQLLSVSMDLVSCGFNKSRSVFYT